MQSLKRFLPALVVLGANFSVAASADAQLFGPGTSSLSSVALLGAGNISSDGTGNIAVYPTAEQYSSTGQAVMAAGSQTFTGNDSQGNSQVMTLSGTAKAQAEYGVLHAYATGQVLNPYYNAANPAYYPGGTQPNRAGSPQYLEVFGQTLFSDTLTLNPTIDPVVGLRYIFHLDGNVVDDGHDYAYLSFSAGQYSTTFFTSPGVTGGDWATPEWNVTPGSPILMSGNFGAVFLVNADVSFTPEGQTVSGTADFYNTLSLSSIQLLDANGNQVNGATYLTASGTHYNVLGATYGPAAVPEPGSIALLVGLGISGATLFLKRRRKGDFFMRFAKLALAALLTLGTVSAHANQTFTFAYTFPGYDGTPNRVSASGLLTTTNLNISANAYTILAISGTRNFNGTLQAITGLLAPGVYLGNDNLLFATAPLLNSNGFSYTVNGVGNTGSNVNVFYTALPSYTEYDGDTAYGAFNVTNVTPVPEPGSLALLGGLIASGAILFLKRRC